jgi:two-component system NtrC family sensor kinase
LPKDLIAPERPAGQLLGILQECAEQIARLSRQLLGFKRPGELERHITTFADVLGRALALTQPVLKNVQLRDDLQYRGPLACAAPLLTQALSNLLENAAQAAGPDGWVQIATREQNGHLIVEVSDSGGGVPPDLRERIFEPFFTTKPPGSGTGLGLTTARQIVEQHDGTLQVRDAPHGSLFHLELPLQASGPLREQRRQRGGMS